LCPSSCVEVNGSDIEQSQDVDALMKVWILTGQQASVGSDALDLEVSEVVVVAVDCSHSMSKPLKKKEKYNGEDADLDPLEVEKVLSEFDFKLLAYGGDEVSPCWLGVQLLTLEFPSASVGALFNASKRHYIKIREQKRDDDKRKLQIEAEKDTEISHSNVPDGFLCPITHTVMVDPVIAGDGQTYERDAIERWLRTHSTSPMTGAKMESTSLTSNFALRDVINQVKSSASFMVREKVSSMTSEKMFHIIYRGTRRDYLVATSSQAIDSFLDSHVPKHRNSIRGGKYVEEEIDPAEVELARSKWTFTADELDSSLIYAIDEPVGKPMNYYKIFYPE